MQNNQRILKSNERCPFSRMTCTPKIRPINRHGSQERGQLWKNIVDSLNKLHNQQFRVTQISVRDHFAVVVKNHKAKKKEQEHDNGIIPEQSEVDDGMLQLIEQFNYWRSDSCSFQHHLLRP